MLKSETRRFGWRPSGGNDASDSHCDITSTATQRQVCLLAAKRGRDCCIAKLVLAQPLGELVLAMVYRHRQTVDHVSLPPSALAYALRQACRLWLVRLDADGRCLSLPVADVGRVVGWLKPSDGKPEWFVPIARFTPIDWQDWEYVEDTVRLDDEIARPDGRQMTMWPEVRE